VGGTKSSKLKKDRGDDKETSGTSGQSIPFDEKSDVLNKAPNTAGDTGKKSTGVVRQGGLMFTLASNNHEDINTATDTDTGTDTGTFDSNTAPSPPVHKSSPSGLPPKSPRRGSGLPPRPRHRVSSTSPGSSSYHSGFFKADDAQSPSSDLSSPAMEPATSGSITNKWLSSSGVDSSYDSNLDPVNSSNGWTMSPVGALASLARFGSSKMFSKEENLAPGSFSDTELNEKANKSTTKSGILADSDEGYSSDPGVASSEAAAKSLEQNPQKTPAPGALTPEDALDHLQWGDRNSARKNAERAAAFVDTVTKVNSNQNSAHQVQASDSMPDDASQNRRGFGANRRHARSVTGDGTFSYQSKTMEPVEWTISGLGGSFDSSKEQGVLRRADWKTNNNHKEISSHQQDGVVSSKFF